MSQDESEQEAIDVRLLYFDFDHGMERELAIEMDRDALALGFRFERSPDPTHDETNADVTPVTVTASVQCADLPEFDGFCHAIVEAMRETPFSLQDPDGAPYEPIPMSTFRLTQIPPGLPAERLGCRIPAEVVVELLSRDRFSGRFHPLISIPKEWKPEEFWYEGDEAGTNRKFCVRFDEDTLTVELELSPATQAGGSGADVDTPASRVKLLFPDLAQMRGLLHALVSAMGEAGRFASAFVLGVHAGKTGGRSYRPARIELDRVGEFCLRYVPKGADPAELRVRIPSAIVAELVPPPTTTDAPVPDVWLPLVED